MLKKLAIATLAVLFLAPSLILVGIGVVMNPALTATGGLVLVGISLRLLQIRQIPVGDMLPALVVAPLLTQLVISLG